MPPESAGSFAFLSPRAQAGWITIAAVAFHVAQEFTICAPLLVLFLFAVLRLAYIPSNRVALVGTTLGLLIYAPQLGFFRNILGPGAVALWFVLAFFIVLFLLLQRRALLQFGTVWGPLSAPLLWAGLEYTRSELYYLRFSWLSIGYSFPDLVSRIGVYGVGLFMMLTAALIAVALKTRKWLYPATAFALSVIPVLPKGDSQTVSTLKIVGVQLELPATNEVIPELDKVVAEHPDASLIVLSEYTFRGPVPESVQNWCALHRRYLIAGGKAPAGRGSNNFYNTAFVIGPDGKEIFRQAKAVPVQFMNDGKPALEQHVWNSPWGRIGIGTCYDLSYARVIDELVRQNAQALIVPTMDAQSWGRSEHELHARVAPVRAAEYGIPIFRLASSGISQAVTSTGDVIASAPFPGRGETLAATLNLPAYGKLPLDRFLVWPCVSFVLMLFGLDTVLSFNAQKRTTASGHSPAPNA